MLDQLETLTLSTFALGVGGASAVVALLAICLYPSQLVAWLDRKRYQYEVTFSLYMLTRTERFIFNSVLFLTVSLTIIAASLYLPEHLAQISRKATYYYAGGREPHPLDPSAAAAGGPFVVSSGPGEL